MRGDAANPLLSRYWACAGPADQLAKLADLRDRGVISAEEFDRKKAKLLAA